MSDSEDNTSSGSDNSSGSENSSGNNDLRRQAVAWFYNATQMYCADDKELKRDRKMTGKEWILQCLDGHPGVCRDRYRLSPTNFRILCNELRDRGLKCTGDVIVEEKVGMFLQLVSHGAVLRIIANDFQHSEETVWRSIHEVVEHVLLMVPDYIKLSGADAPIPAKVREGSKFHAFKDALGAIDGTHIEAYPDSEETFKERWRDRHGKMSQNVMGVVDFDGYFLAVDAGWEGSTHDQTVLRRAIEDGFIVTEGRYYLVDCGYTNSDKFLAPYRKSMYHLAAFQARNSQNRYDNAEELFNLRHAQLRNTVEKAFGNLKGTFKICKTMHRFRYAFQINIVVACCVLHNFIKRHHHLQGVPDDSSDDSSDEDCNTNVASSSCVGRNVPEQRGTDAQRGGELRDKIRDMLWAGRRIRR